MGYGGINVPGASLAEMNAALSAHNAAADSHKDIRQRLSGDNLLDNPDLNIWQRYPTKTYTGVPSSAYLADRFLFTSSNGDIQSTITAVDGGGIKNVSGPNCRITQRIENASRLNGKTVTLSMLKDSGLITHTITPNDWGDASDIFAYFNTPLRWLNAGETIYRVKLELGSQQTLAHQENGVWVLNDPPPDPATELMKCQRYYENNFGGPELTLTRVMEEFGHSSPTFMWKVQKRANPTVKLYTNESHETQGVTYQFSHQPHKFSTAVTINMATQHGVSFFSPNVNSATAECVTYRFAYEASADL